MGTQIGRKAAMAWFVTTTSTIFFGAGLLSESGYITVVTLCLGIYGTANVAAKALHK